MRITIFGATGRTGIRLLRQALEAGYEVTAAVRRPEAVTERSERLQVVAANTNDEKSVAEAVTESDAVVSVIGHKRGSSPDILERGARNITTAMAEQGVRRLIVLTGTGVRFPRDRPGIFDRLLNFLFRLGARKIYRDGVRATRVIGDSELDWTIVRAGLLTRRPGNNRYRVGRVGTDTGVVVSRENIASFILRELETNEYVRQAPAVSDR